MCRDSNSQPLEHKSPPITTRPGLRPFYLLTFTDKCQDQHLGMAGWSLLTPGDPGSNPALRNFLNKTCVNFIDKTKIKKKRQGEIVHLNV